MGSGDSKRLPSTLVLLRSLLCSVKWISTLFYRHICTYVFFFPRQHFALNCFVKKNEIAHYCTQVKCAPPVPAAVLWRTFAIHF